MSRDELKQLIVEAGERLYGDKDSHVHTAASIFTAEFLNAVEELILEVLCGIEEIKDAENTDVNVSD